MLSSCWVSGTVLGVSIGGNENTVSTDIPYKIHNTEKMLILRMYRGGKPVFCVMVI